LTIVVSGSATAFSTVSPYLELLGKNIFFLEKPGLATRMKLINNLLLGSFMAAISESVTLAEAAGIEKERALDILQVGAGNSGVLSAKRQKLLSEDFSPHFSSALIHKDLTCLLDLAKALNCPAPTGEAVRAIYEKAMSSPYRDLDFSVLYRVLKDMNAADR
jgi:3-hydroxyisobutyrate dehydrogenase